MFLCLGVTHHYFFGKDTLRIIAFAPITIDCGLMVAIYARAQKKQGQTKSPQMESLPNVGTKVKRIFQRLFAFNITLIMRIKKAEPVVTDSAKMRNNMA